MRLFFYSTFPRAARPYACRPSVSLSVHAGASCAVATAAASANRGAASHVHECVRGQQIQLHINTLACSPRPRDRGQLDHSSVYYFSFCIRLQPCLCIMMLLSLYICYILPRLHFSPTRLHLLISLSLSHSLFFLNCLFVFLSVIPTPTSTTTGLSLRARARRQQRHTRTWLPLSAHKPLFVPDGTVKSADDHAHKLIYIYIQKLNTIGT